MSEDIRGGELIFTLDPEQRLGVFYHFHDPTAQSEIESSNLTLWEGTPDLHSTGEHSPGDSLSGHFPLVPFLTFTRDTHRVRLSVVLSPLESEYHGSLSRRMLVHLNPLPGSFPCVGSVVEATSVHSTTRLLGRVGTDLKTGYLWPPSIYTQQNSLIPKPLNTPSLSFTYLTRVLVGSKRPGRCSVGWAWRSGTG